jgi:hypothetical protein
MQLDDRTIALLGILCKNKNKKKKKKKQFTLAGELGEAIILSWKNKSTTRRLETTQVGVFLVNKM